MLQRRLCEIWSFHCVELQDYSLKVHDVTHSSNLKIVGARFTESFLPICKYVYIQHHIQNHRNHETNMSTSRISKQKRAITFKSMHRLETRTNTFEVWSKLFKIFLIWILYLFYEETTYHCSRFGTLENDARYTQQPETHVATTLQNF
jgi:hypothetical protein